MRGESLLDWALKETTTDVKKVGSTVADSSYSNNARSLSPLPSALCPPLPSFFPHACNSRKQRRKWGQN
jgi:hypothetical protein